MAKVLHEIAFEMERSTAIALKKCKKRLASELANVGPDLVLMNEQKGGTSKHSCDHAIHEKIAEKH